LRPSFFAPLILHELRREPCERLHSIAALHFVIYRLIVPAAGALFTPDSVAKRFLASHRKMITTLNAMLRDNVAWQPKSA